MSLSFDDQHFAFPTVSEERMAQLLALAERDYGALAAADRDTVIGELARKLTEQFFAAVRVSLTRALEEAEKKGDEERSASILAQLHILNKRRHGDT
jgi:hypothetical protein